MTEEFDRIIYCGLFSGKRRILISNDFLYYQKKKISINRKDGFGRDDIAGFKFGMEWLRLDVVFGRRYTISVSNHNGKVITIRFSRYFGIGANAAHELYAGIIDSLLEHYFLQKVETVIEEFEHGKEISLGRISITSTGITIKNTFSSVFLPWEDVRTKNYYSYLAVYSAANPANVNFSFSYADDWNTVVLRRVLDAILHNKNIETY